MPENDLEKAKQSIRSGDSQGAYNILVSLINDDPRNEEAWLWMSAVVKGKDKKIQSLQTVLEINPNNAAAKKGLNSLGVLSNEEFSSRENIIERTHQEPYNNVELKDQTSLSVPNIVIISLTVIVILCIGLSLTFVYMNFIAQAESEQDPESSTFSQVLDTPEQQPTQTVFIPPTNTRVDSNELTPTEIRQESTEIPSCASGARDFILDLEPHINEFNDTIEVALSTPRIALGPIIQDLQAIKRSMEEIPAPECGSSASNLFFSGINNVINSQMDFMGGEGDLTVRREFEQGLLEMENGLSQLGALAQGEMTPVPRQLPTRTPIPTPIPTDTPLPPGSTIIVNDWQITVERIEVTDQLTVFDETTKAVGRYLILFLYVTNLGRSPESFLGLGTIDILDAEGLRYEEDSLAHFDAYFIYENQVSLGVDINPDTSARVLAVYDVSISSDYYVLVPGRLADSYGPSVYLNVPP